MLQIVDQDGSAAINQIDATLVTIARTIVCEAPRLTDGRRLSH